MKRAAIVLMALASLLLADDAAYARHRMSFVPGGHGGSVSSQRHGHYAWRGHRHRGSATASRRGRGRSGSRGDADEGAAAPPPPGSGFKMEDGVLTYPAPARFQPKNLKHL